jgi:LuxR family maltose regulon positive regulatory protein
MEVAWVSVSPELDDALTFLSHLATALGLSSPGDFTASARLLEAAAAPQAEALGYAILNDLEGLEAPCLVVLDGIEAIHDPWILKWLSSLLLHPPTHFHLVVAGRRDPFLPIARLRAKGEFVEIRVKDLRFTPHEALSLLESVGHPAARLGTAESLVRATEGWIMGLRLALLEGPEGPESAESYRVLNRHVSEYLNYEVLERQPAGLRRTLLALSIPSRISAPVCEAVYRVAVASPEEEATGDGILECLRGYGLFLIPLDEDHQSFRLHGMVRAFLRTHLEREVGPMGVKAIHRGLSRWFEDAGMIGEAVTHSVQAEDFAHARSLVTAHLDELLEEGDGSALREIVDRFPEAEADGAQDLLLARAWAEFLLGSGEAAEALIDRASEFLETEEEGDGARTVRAQVAAFRSALFSSRGELGKAASQAGYALEHLPESSHFHLGTAQVHRISALWRNGDREEAITLAEKCLADASRRSVRARGRILALLCSLHWLDGDLSRLEVVAERCIEHGRRWSLSGPLARAHLFRGMARYQLNDLPGADSDLSAAREHLGALDPFEALSLWHALALVFQASGRGMEMSEMDGHIAELGERLGPEDPRIGTLVSCMRSELALLQRDPETALDLLNDTVPWPSPGARSAPEASAVAHLHPTRSKARAFLFRPSDNGGVGPGNEMLTLLRSTTDAQESLHGQLEGLALEALFLCREGFEDAALVTADRVLAMAKSAGYIRVFVDLGPPFMDLLKGMARRPGPHTGFVREIVGAYYDDRLVSGGWEGRASQSNGSDHGPVSQQLTVAEEEVLRLLSQGLLYREIAERRFVSVETVKTHLKHVYRKLNVGNRRQAVHKARLVGLT